MTTFEKLFVQIFERKDWIIEEVQRQADAYTEQLAARLLIDRITPPPSLLNHRFNYRSSDPHELKKEEIISKLLLQHPRDSVCYSTGGHSLYDKPVVPRGNGQLSNQMCIETHDPNKVFNVANEPTNTLASPNNDIRCSLNCVTEQDNNVKSPQNETDTRISSIYAAPDSSLATIQRSRSSEKGLNVTNGSTKALESPSNDIECSLNCVTEQDNNVNSPQNETDVRISSIYAAPDSSLARIQRSKSRQKALELRNSAKTAAKSCLSKEDRTRISFTEDTISQNDFHQVTQDKCPSQPDKCNDHSKTNNKEELDGKSSQQSGNAVGVMEGVNLADTSLGSYEPKKSVTDKTHDTQRESKPYSGRITRSRGSSQQTSGINKFLELGTSASCNEKEDRGVLSYSVSGLKHRVDASNKLLDAVETSQVCSERIVETQAICSSKEVKKPVISSNVVASRVTNHQENAEIVMGNGLLDVAVAVDSGKKLDPVVTMCMESDGLALKQSSECCMHVKPKQLNFDEPDGCDSNKISSLASRKRKLDGLLGEGCSPSNFEQQLPMENEVLSKSKSARTHSHEDFDECTNVETMDIGLDMNESSMVKRKSDGLLGQDCNHSMDSDSSIDHKSVGTSFEQNSPMENNVVSSQSKAAGTLSYGKFDECAKDEMVHMNENPMVEDVEHNSRVSLLDPVAILCEVDKGEESASIPPVSTDPNPSFTSCLTKQGEIDFEACLDKEVRPSSLGMELENGTNSQLSSFKLNSAKGNTWPRVPQRNAEDQRNRLSDSHIQRDAIHCDLEASEIDLHFSRLDDIQKRVDDDEMTCHLPDRRESLHELQAAEETVADMDDDTHIQSEPNVLNLYKSETDYDDDDVAVSTEVGSDEMMPVYEGFTIDAEVEGGIDFDTLEIPSTTIERASILEKLCKSANTHTPFSQFSSTFKQHQVQDLYKFIPDNLLENVDMGNSEDFGKHIPESDCCDITEADYTFAKQKTFDSVQFSGTPYYWQSKNYYSSPVGKLWERSTSSSGSSGNRLSSNPELTCFPIEEDPDSNEESENEQFQENITVKAATANEDEVPVTETENVATEKDDEVAFGIVPKVAEREPLSGPMKYRDRCSSNSVNIEVNVPRTHDKVKYQSKFHPGYKSSRYEEEMRTPSVSTRTSVRRNASLQTQNSKNIRSGIKRPSQKEGKRNNNVVSNVPSFVSIVQQKQAAAVAPVRRDIKVKALEAAEAAKRREQEKENERKMKKEALKIERARVEKENAREMELNKKKKMEEMKKKEADVAARKKQREEDERKQVAKKRKIAEVRKEQKVQHEKARSGKNVPIAANKKGPEKVRQDKNADERNEKSLADVIQQVTCVAEKETNVFEKSPGQVGSMMLTSQETSYDISPYQCSDDEDEEEDDLPSKKFVPSWANKRAVAMVLPLQHELDPETIFPVGSLCSMDEVLLPRRLQTQ